MARTSSKIALETLSADADAALQRASDAWFAASAALTAAVGTPGFELALARHDAAHDEWQRCRTLAIDTASRLEIARSEAAGLSVRKAAA